MQICTYDISTERRIGRRKMMSGENSSDSGLSLIQETRREQLEAVDKLKAEITKRAVQMNALHELFAFLQIQTLLEAKKKKRLHCWIHLAFVCEIF